MSKKKDKDNWFGEIVDNFTRQVFSEDRSIQDLAARKMQIESEWLEAFCKCFMAHEVLKGVAFDDVFKDHVLKIQHCNEGNNITTKYWIEKKD